MIQTLIITLLLEGMVAWMYAVCCNKPVRSILLTSIIANTVTQSLLWVVLTVFFREYLTVLLLAEVVIWITEAILLHGVRFNALKFKEALLLSFYMNFISVTFGWFLPF